MSKDTIKTLEAKIENIVQSRFNSERYHAADQLFNRIERFFHGEFRNYIKNSDNQELKDAHKMIMTGIHKIFEIKHERYMKINIERESEKILNDFKSFADYVDRLRADQFTEPNQ